MSLLKQCKQYLLLAFLFIAVLSNAQTTNNRVIRGVVMDADNATPLEGVAVLAKYSQLVSESQTDGVFAIPVKEKDSILIFQFNEYETREIRLNGSDQLQVSLQKSKPGFVNPDITVLAGIWRGVFTIKAGVDVPFHFIISPNGGEGAVSLVNGEEKFPAGNLRIIGDSIFIPLPLFENELALQLQNDHTITGVLRRQDLRGNPVPVKAEKGLSYRFEENGSSALKDISGNYDVVFANPNGKEEKAVGIFRQKGNKVSATFLRITGDARYLEGNIEDNRIQLSAFIGSSPSLYTAVVNSDGTLKGENVNARGAVPFTAVPNPNAALPDAYTLTNLKEGVNTFQFRFQDADGNWVSSTDEKFHNKPLVIAIGGTWCPNCMDEAGFLGPWYQQNKQRGVEVIALQYERQTDAPFIKKAFDRFRKQFGIQYTMLIGGLADKQAVVQSLPALQNFLSFPTTIFIDRTGKVQKIHTGFSGPATGIHYTEFLQEFNEEVNKLLQ